MLTRSIVALLIVAVVTVTAIVLCDIVLCEVKGNDKPFPRADRTLQSDVVHNSLFGEFMNTIVQMLTWTDHEGNNSIRGGNRGKKRSSAYYKCNSRFNSEMIFPDESDEKMIGRTYQRRRSR